MLTVKEVGGLAGTAFFDVLGNSAPERVISVAGLQRRGALPLVRALVPDQPFSGVVLVIFLPLAAAFPLGMPLRRVADGGVQRWRLGKRGSVRVITRSALVAIRGARLRLVAGVAGSLGGFFQGVWLGVGTHGAAVSGAQELADDVLYHQGTADVQNALIDQFICSSFFVFGSIMSHKI